VAELISSFDPLVLFSAFAGIVLFALMLLFMQGRGEMRSRSEVRKRLEVPHQRAPEAAAPLQPKANTSRAARSIAKKTNDFYATNDPKALRKIQLQLIQAGYLHENALGMFLAARVSAGVAFTAIGFLAVLILMPDASMTTRFGLVLLMGATGYLGPNFVVSNRIKKLQDENRSGFPDVMDLMIVAAEAGLTLEASIERIAKEISKTYPTLSQQLGLAALEIRAGRPLDQSLRAFGERLGIDEVQGFATMIQQSKELGTSVSDALRVYSEEMRHKRMMKAEERAYALPAKLSIPVTAFILPVVIGIAVMPTAVRMMNQ
jgi:tight adherence protein C